MKLSKAERETIIIFNEYEKEATVSTYNPTLKGKLAKLAEDRPEEVKLDPERTTANDCGGVFYTVPKKWVKITAPRTLSEEQKERLREMMRQRGL